jgi:apolipoprotein N-acyltransferase
LLSGVLFPLALPNELFLLGSPVVGLVALVPYYVALRETSDARTAARLGAIFGGVSTIIANYWLMFFGDYSIWTIGGTTIGYVGYNWLLGGFLWRVVHTRRAYRPVLFAAVWMGYEYLKSIGFLGYPWGLAAYPFNELTIFNQVVDVTGVWALSFLAVYANAVIAELVSARRRSPWLEQLGNPIMLCLLVIATGIYGQIRVNEPVPVQDTVDLVLVQQNADAWNTRDISGPLLTSQRETEAGIAAWEKEPELIVWSETTLRYFYVESRSWYERNPSEKPFLTFVSELPAPLLTGAPFQNPDDEFAYHNAVLLIDQDTEVTQWYGKQHLVPFAELIPFWQTEMIRTFFQDVIGIPGIWAPGPGIRLFTIQGNGGSDVLIGTPICFEDGFSYMVRRHVKAGADLVINLTNNSWSRTNSAQLQHFVAARYRAIETRRGLVRSTNSGYTSVLDPWGRVTESAPMFESNHLNVTVNVYEPAVETIYVLWGDYLPQLTLALLGILMLVAETKKRSASRRPSFLENPIRQD